MGIRSRLKEAFGIRVKVNPSGIDNTNVSRTGLVDILNDGTTLLDRASLGSLRTLANTRNEQYRAYDRMLQDSLISSAIEMYADDATPANRQGQVIWAESENKDIAAFCNRLLNVLGINDNAWSHIYSLCTYGDVYLKLFYDSEKAVKQTTASDGLVLNSIKKGYVYSEYVEQVPNPADIFDITYRGKTVGFADMHTPAEEAVDAAQNYYIQYNTLFDANKDELYDERSFVHISLNTGTRRVPETITLDLRTEDGEVKSTNFNVKRGRSLLENVFTTYQDLSLMEDAILLNRVSRSSIIRLMQIEVGDMPKNKVNELLKRMKDKVEQKNLMDKTTGDFKSQAAPGPVDNIIYTTTRNGKGAISLESIGGDVDVKSITDVDHYSNKLAAGFRIPRQYLGLDSPDNGFSGGVSATKVDARYARSVMRVQTAYIDGITTLLNLYAIDRGFDDYVNNFSIKMVSPSTTEDAERDDTLKVRLDITDAIMSLLGDAYDEETKKEAFEYLMNQFMNDPDFVEILKKDETLDEAEESTETSGDTEGEAEEGGFGSAEIDTTPDADIDINMDTGSEEISDMSTNELTADESSSEDFGDYSNEVT